jgi:hypothetical protein
MDIFGVGLTFLSVGAGIYASVKPMKPRERTFWIITSVSLGVIGIGMIVYNFISGGAEIESPKTIPSISQMNMNSPGGINALGDVTVNNPEANPNAPVITYDFNGAKRIARPGGMAVGTGPQWEAFQEMMKLDQAQNWTALRDLCEAEIKKTPEWITPALCAGRAYIELGDIDKAIERLDYVHDKAGGNPDYVVADQIREVIRRKFGK